MWSLYIFCLLCSTLVLAADTEKLPTPAVSNGLQCPTCQSLKSDSCTDKLAPCHGDEKHCVNATGKILKDKTESSSFVIKGCAVTSDINSMLGTSNIKPDETYEISSLTYEPAHTIPTEPPTTPTETSSTTMQAPPGKPDKDPPSDGSPHISSALSFVIWLPSMSWLLLTMLLS